MTALPDNLFKYYANTKPVSEENDNKAQDTEIEVISEEEAKKPPHPPTPPPKKSGKLFTGKRIIVAVILFLIAVDIPIGLQLVRQSKDNRTPARTPSPTTQPQALLAPSPTTIPSPISPTPTSPITPISLITPILTSIPEATTSAGATELGQLETAVQTHSECFNGACIEIEGPGVDQCIVDDDCLQPSPTEASELADSGVGGSGLKEPTAEPTTEEVTSPAIPVPDTPAAGNITNTIIGIFGGLGVLLVALIL